MIVLKRATLPFKTVNHALLKRNLYQVLRPAYYNHVDNEPKQINTKVQFLRNFHVTTVNRDLESGLKALGAGIAATGVIGSGIGLGIIFGNLLSAMARNPSLSNKIFTNAVMGAAFCESLGLLAGSISFILMP